MTETETLRYLKGLMAFYIVLTLIIFAAFGKWLVEKFPEEEKAAVKVLIDYTEYGEYNGQKEIGDTNMIYHIFNETNHVVRVMKNDVFSFEKYYDTGEEAIQFMENYSEYERRAQNER